MQSPVRGISVICGTGVLAAQERLNDLLGHAAQLFTRLVVETGPGRRVVKTKSHCQPAILSASMAVPASLVLRAAGRAAAFERIIIGHPVAGGVDAPRVVSGRASSPSTMMLSAIGAAASEV